MKKLLCWILALTLVLGYVPRVPVSAEETIPPETEGVPVPSETESVKNQPSSEAETVPETSLETEIAETWETTGETVPEPEEAQVILIDSWVINDPDEILEDGKLNLYGVGEDQALTEEDIAAMLPQSILSEGREIPVSWQSPAYHTGSQGDFIFAGKLPAGYAFSETAKPLEILVHIPLTETQQEMESQDPAQDISYTMIIVSRMTFPDDAFRQWVLDNIDLNGDKELSQQEMEGVTEISLQNKNVTTLKGIAFFPNLKTLDCSQNYITTLDLSQNPALTSVSCYQNTLESINLNGLKDLRSLNCVSNFSLKTLDLSQNPRLQILRCGECGLSALDLSSNEELEEIYVMNNSLTDLDLRRQPILKVLSCENNYLNRLDLSYNKELQNCDAGNNALAFLDLTGNPGITAWSLTGNIHYPVGVNGSLDLTRIKGFDLSRASDWQGGHVENGILTPDQQNGQISYQYACNDRISEVFHMVIKTTVPISSSYFPDAAFRKWVQMNVDTDQDGFLSAAETDACREISVPMLDIGDLTGISYFARLQRLICPMNRLEELDVSKNPELTELNCHSNALTELDVSKNPQLQKLNCMANHLTSLELRENPALTELRAEENVYHVNSSELRLNLSSLPGFDRSRVMSVYYGVLDRNNLLPLAFDQSASYVYDCGGGFTPEFSVIIHSTLPVDKAHFPDPDFRAWIHEYADGDMDGMLTEQERLNVKYIFAGSSDISSFEGLSYFPNAEELDCSGNGLQTLDISKNRNLLNLDVSNNKLKSLDLSQNEKLQNLVCTINDLEALDVSRCPDLKVLICSVNYLSSLKLDQNPKLEMLDCAANRLTSLDLSQNLLLWKLGCDSNRLTSLNLVGNTELTQFSGLGQSFSAGTENGQLRLSDLPGFEEKKASGWQGGAPENGILIPDTVGSPVSYTYDCGNGHFLACSITLHQGIQIDEGNFPDAVFRDWVSKNVDSDHNGTLTPEEIIQTRLIVVSGMNVKSLKGIEFFSELMNLTCNDCQISSLDLSQNSKLEALSCGRNQLQELKISGCPILQSLYCEENLLEELDLSHNTRIQELDCSGNRLHGINVSALEELNGLICGHNPMTQLDVSQNKLLTCLHCENMHLTSLDLSQNRKLDPVMCVFTGQSWICGTDTVPLPLSRLPGFDPARASDWQGGSAVNDLLAPDTVNQPVTYVYDLGNGMKETFSITFRQGLSIDERTFPDPVFRNWVLQNADWEKNGVLSQEELDSIQEIRIGGAGAESLKGIEYFANLKLLSCGGNQIKNLDVSSNKELITLFCDHNEMKSLNVRGAAKLRNLQCGSNQLHQLDVSQNYFLQNLGCQMNSLKKLDLQNNQDLLQLNCSGNRVSELDLAHNQKLTHLYCIASGLTELDLSQNTVLQDLRCAGNCLHHLELTGCRELKTCLAENQTYICRAETLNLAELPGFILSRASEWENGSVKDGILTPDQPGLAVTYLYDCGQNFSLPFSILFHKPEAGWHQNSGGWHYIHADGSYTENNFEKIDGKWYYFGQKGYMVTGWKLVSGKYYYFASSGNMVTGWQKIGGKHYYFESSGAMAVSKWIGTSYVGSDGAWDPAKKPEAKGQWKKYNSRWWYRHGDGTCTKSDFEKIDAHWYYFDAEGYMVTGWKLVSGKYYYFDSNGWMAVGWRKISGSYYYFSSSGTMATGWQKIDGKHYYFESSGAMAADKWIGDSYVGADGAWDPAKKPEAKAEWRKYGSKWWYRHADGTFTKSGFERIAYHWYYFDAEGYMVTGWKLVSGKYYYFDSNGWMVVGWKQISGKYYYFDGSGAMLTGWQHIGSQDYYFYKTGEMAVNTWIGSSYVGSDGAWIPGKTKALSAVYKENFNQKPAEEFLTES